MKKVCKSFLVFSLLTGLAFSSSAQERDPGLERLKALVDMGAAPRSALEKAQATIDDRQDDAILKRTLYGELRVEDFTGTNVSEMISAAERRLERVEKRLAEVKPLVEQGIYARNTLDPLNEELAFRQNTLQLARDRASFVRRLAEMAEAEQAVQTEIAGPALTKPVWRRFDGKAPFSAPRMKSLFAAYEKKFGRQMPVSAYGTTAFHRALGFDHTGRMDVQLNPDSVEGEWTMKLLETLDIPFFAFRGAVAGSASGAHIHVGPPSLRKTAVAD